ncbi:hypothetical protein EC973_003682 [Apophysomyces ossiformis]|uniref:Uncharacterized protein n=1 Tax=Apophysomyces ossiformis TaxID=679940 RepID=A0A8H7BHQ0_9FUNG|nr:hypothetical protein EC973_003682 [Apophysomyces ossiformis]
MTKNDMDTLSVGIQNMSIQRKKKVPGPNRLFNELLETSGVSCSKLRQYDMDGFRKGLAKASSSNADEQDFIIDHCIDLVVTIMQRRATMRLSLSREEYPPWGQLIERDDAVDELDRILAIYNIQYYRVDNSEASLAEIRLRWESRSNAKAYADKKAKAIANNKIKVKAENQ